MIIVHGTIPIRPERRDRALAMARRMSEATQLEPGCISYDFYVGLRNPNTLMLFQEWESIDALADHFETPHMERFLRELPEVANGSVTTRRFAVQEVEDLDDSDEPETVTQSAPRIVH